MPTPGDHSLNEELRNEVNEALNSFPGFSYQQIMDVAIKVKQFQQTLPRGIIIHSERARGATKPSMSYSNVGNIVTLLNKAATEKAVNMLDHLYEDSHLNPDIKKEVREAVLNNAQYSHSKMEDCANKIKSFQATMPTEIKTRPERSSSLTLPSKEYVTVSRILDLLTDIIKNKNTAETTKSFKDRFTAQKNANPVNIIPEPDPESRPTYK